jgi:hypothetical protein
MRCWIFGRRRGRAAGAVAPEVGAGSPTDYRRYEARARELLEVAGRPPDDLERVDAAFNYSKNRITLFNLQEPGRELSVADTLSHEWLHAVLDRLGEWRAARLLDAVVRPVGDADRRGGL